MDKHYNWYLLRESFKKRLGNSDYVNLFRREKRRHLPLVPFKKPLSLIEYLTGGTEDREFKDCIYRCLIKIAQQQTTKDLGLAILSLGMWPRLTKFYRINECDYPDDTGPLISEIWDCFTLVVGRANLDRINKVTATLAMNTERAYYYRRHKQRVRAKRELPQRREDEFKAIDNVFATMDVSRLGIVPWLSPEEELTRLYDLLFPVVGKNTDLVIRAIVYGETLKRLSEGSSLSYEALRKRYQRAVKALKIYILLDNASDQSMGNSP